MKRLIFVSAIFLSMLTTAAAAQTKVRVKFVKGASSTTVKGKVKGYNYIDYLVRARTGQTLSVDLKSAHGGCSFVLFYSNMENVEAATDVRQFTNRLEADDDYIIRVLLPRSAARRKESADFSLKITIN